MKYKPKTYSELYDLVWDFNIYLGDIDTSEIDDMSELFFNIYLGDIDTSEIDDMSELFFNCERKDYSGINLWDTSNVKNMNSMFCYAEYFNENISSWNVSNVTNMSSMFNGASSFNQDISSWNVSNVKDMYRMFGMYLMLQIWQVCFMVLKSLIRIYLYGTLVM